jgi:hypothetical protein
VTQPCRTFQQAYNTAAANGEIDVLDPAGYGPLTITHGISIQAHGFGGITQICNPRAAITISVTTSDPVTLNGLLIDGGGHRLLRNLHHVGLVSADSQQRRPPFRVRRLLTGVQARHRGSKNLAAIEERKPVAESRPRSQIPKRHRGH